MMCYTQLYKSLHIVYDLFVYIIILFYMLVTGPFFGGGGDYSLILSFWGQIYHAR